MEKKNVNGTDKSKLVRRPRKSDLAKSRMSDYLFEVKREICESIIAFLQWFRMLLTLANHHVTAIVLFFIYETLTH